MAAFVSKRVEVSRKAGAIQSLGADDQPAKSNDQLRTQDCLRAVAGHPHQCREGQAENR